MKKASRGRLGFELGGILLVTIGLLGLAGFFTTAVGPVGLHISHVFSVTAGHGKYVLAVLFVILGVKVMYHNRFRTTKKVYGLLILFLSVLIMLHIEFPFDDKFILGRQGEGGGIVGAAATYVLYLYFSSVGSYIILFGLTLLGILLFTGIPFSQLARSLSDKTSAFLKETWQKINGFIYEEVEIQAPVHENKLSPLLISGQPLNELPVIETEGGTGLGQGFEDTIVMDRLQSENSGANNKKKISDKKKKHTSETGNTKQESGFPSIEPASAGGRAYRYPQLSLLNKSKTGADGNTSKEVMEKAHILEDTLSSFGIPARVTQVCVGPTVTRYEVQPPVGIKVSRIVGLSDDIALSMATSSVRIEAPIPGKAAVGIEVPNKKVSAVYMREILDSNEFRNMGSKLTVALGKDITGIPVVTDLGTMPHLLVAGATGSGKSVCLNALITSILFKASPEEVKFLIIDPKMVELVAYNGIPHLVSPVVTNAKKAAGALHWAVKEMEKRYELFADAGVREIIRYNNLCAEKNDGTRPMPYMVVIIDELADLMMVAPADVEDSICRLAQMARAAGIHLVVATQRPSVDVITGLIKANIPSRISFAVSSQTDSRTILDTGGAEKLLGKGDMLFFPVGASKPVRLQGVYLSDKEVESVVNFLKNQAEPSYDDQVLAEPLARENSLADSMDDELIPEAAKIFIESGSASISMLQRRLRIGYARAARLVDIMERRGIIGGFDGSKPRAVLMTLEQYAQTFTVE